MACILIVEDDAGFQPGWLQHLEPRGHEIVMVATAEEALEVATEKTFDLAVIDLILPGMDGAELIRQLRKDEATCGITIVAFTCMLRQMGLGFDARDRVWLPADEVLDKTEGIEAVAIKIEALLMGSSLRGKMNRGPEANRDDLAKE